MSAKRQAKRAAQKAAGEINGKPADTRWASTAMRGNIGNHKTNRKALYPSTKGLKPAPEEDLFGSGGGSS